MADLIKAPTKSIRNDLTAEYLRSILSYNPMTGEFVWKESRFRSQVGDRAGHKQPNGYVSIRIDGVAYLAHRLAWLYVHGCWPSSFLDHRDRDSSNNRIENLREATQNQNMANAGTQTNNRYGVRGVCFNKARNNWIAYISGKQLGKFATFEEALNVRLEAEKRLHPEFRNG